MPLENYETVAERIEKFWMRYANGRIDQKIIHQDGTRYIVQTDLYRDATDMLPDTCPRVSILDHCQWQGLTFNSSNDMHLIKR